MKPKSELLLVLALFAAGLALRLPFGSAYLYDHDSFLFARAAERYDLRLGQPHPPGYLFYVFLGKWLSPNHDFNRGFLILGALSAGLMASSLFLLGRSIFGPAAGLGAAAASLFSPLMWFYGDIALSYAPDGAITVVLALACWKTLKGRPSAAYASAILIGLAGGFRAWTVPFTLPLWFYCVRRQPARHVLLAGVAAGLACLTWLLPNVYLSGGPSTYFDIVSRYNVGLRREAAVHMTLRGEWTALCLTANWMWWALGPAGLAATAFLVWATVAATRGTSPPGRECAIFLLLWIAPPFLFRLLVHSTSPGYTLSFVPGFALLAGGAVASGARALARPLPRTRCASSVRFLRLALVGGFWAAYGVWGSVTYLTAPAGFTWPTIAANNSALRERLEAIRHQFPPEETVVLAAQWAAHAKYYLPDYRVIDSDFEPGLRAFGPDLSDTARRAYRAVFFDYKVLEAYQGPRQAMWTITLPTGLLLHVLPIPAGSVLKQEPGRFWIEPARPSPPLGQVSDAAATSER